MDFKRLAALVRQFDKDVLVAEIENCNDKVETIDDLSEYLETEVENMEKQEIMQLHEKRGFILIMEKLYGNSNTDNEIAFQRLFF